MALAGDRATDPTLVYGGVASFILLMVVKAITGLRAGEDAEREGLDIALHGESVP
jgi:Amt family ammonium transporter